MMKWWNVLTVLTVLAVLAGGAEVQAQGYDNILWSPKIDDIPSTPFLPVIQDDKGELLAHSSENIWGMVWTSLPEDGINNHHKRQFSVGDYHYLVENRIPSPVEDDWSLGGTLHHRNGALDFHSARRYYAYATVEQKWAAQQAGWIHIPISADAEGHWVMINGQIVWEIPVGERFTGEITAYIPEMTDTLKLEWGGKNDAADIRIEPARFYPDTTVPEPSLGDLIDLIGSGVGGLIGW